MNSADFVEVVAVTVSLEDGQDIPARLQDAANLFAVLDSVVVADVESLMGENDGGSIIRIQIGFQPFTFGGRNVRIGPV